MDDKIVRDTLKNLIGENGVNGENGHDQKDIGAISKEDEIYETVSEFKRNYKLFMIGDLNDHCNKTDRKMDDSWYKWSLKKMESLDKCQIKTNKILKSLGYEKVEEICKKRNGEMWGNTTRKQMSNMIKDLKVIDKKIESKKGLKTKWGKISLKNNNPFKQMVKGDIERIKYLNPSKENVDMNDYIYYKIEQWKQHFEHIKETEDLMKYNNFI